MNVSTEQESMDKSLSRRISGVDRCDFLIALLIGVLVISAFVLATLPNLTTHQLGFEDFGQIVGSGRWFNPSFPDWFTEGNRYTIVNYPELGGKGHLKPLANLSIYLDSLLAPDPNSPLLLTTNYLGQGVVASLGFMMGRRVFELNRSWSILIAVLIGGTLATDMQFMHVSFRGDLIAALVGLSAILLIDEYLRSGRILLAVLTACVLTIGVLSKETALAAPFMVGGFALLRPFILTNRLPRVPELLERFRTLYNLWPFFASPLLIYVGLSMFVLEGTGSTPLRFLSDEIAGIPLWVMRPFHLLATAFFPVELSTFRDFVTREFTNPLADFRGVLAIGLGLVLWYIAFKMKQPRTTLLLALGLVGAAVPLGASIQVRYLFLSQVVLIPVAVLLVKEAEFQLGPQKRHTRMSRGIAASLIGLMLVAGPLYTLANYVSIQEAEVDQNQLMREYGMVLREVFADPSIRRLYLINDPSLGGGLGKLQFYAGLAGRDDVTLRMVNRLENYEPDSSYPNEGVTFSQLSDGRLRIDIIIGGQEWFFGDLVKQDLERLGHPGRITYGEFDGFYESAQGRMRLSDRMLTVFIPDGDDPGLVVIGLDPAHVGVHEYRPRRGEWVSLTK